MIAYLISIFVVGLVGGWCGMTLWMSGGWPRGGHRVAALLWLPKIL